MLLDGLYAYEGGRRFDPALPCVVFLHGAQHDHSVWILQSRYLAHHGHAVLALDLPGHGRSRGPAATSVEAIADRVAQSIAPLANPRFLLVGHSMGSLVALELARRLADRPRAPRAPLPAPGVPRRGGRGGGTSRGMSSGELTGC